MIHDPQIEVTCDKCQYAIHITPAYMYRNFVSNSGYYDCETSSIENLIESQEGWEVIDGQHICEDCQAA